MKKHKRMQIVADNVKKIQRKKRLDTGTTSRTSRSESCICESNRKLQKRHDIGILSSNLQCFKYYTK